MFKQIILPLAGVAAFIILVGLLVKNSGNIAIPGLSTPSPTANPTESLIVGDKTLNVEIADTESKRELGLGGRTSLANDSGMLFIFDKKRVTPGFWMKGMLIPLDIIWISGNQIVKIDKNIPAPSSNAQDSDLTVYTPGRLVDFVLEVNGGTSDQNGWKVGTTIQNLPN